MDMMDMQKLTDTINSVSRDTRAKYHLTLGNLIEILESANPDSNVLAVMPDATECTPGSPHSYRGFYSDLAFRPATEPTTCGQLLWSCREALNTSFEGYKGGDFVMGEDTPLWVSDYGQASHIAITGIINDERGLVLCTIPVDD